MRIGRGAAIAVLAAASFTAVSLPAGSAANSPPATPRITEPVTDGLVVSPADVHMETAPFSDPDAGDTHRCTDWEIWTIAPVERVWVTPCIGGSEKLHTHLGDGSFEHSFAGRFDLQPDRDYRLRVRHRDGSGDPATEWSGWAERYFRTEPALIGTAVPWTFRQPGYRVDVVAGGFQLPVNIAFVPNPGSSPSSPFFYVTELYGTIKVVTRDFTVRDYATGLLNFNPTGNFPGSGEQGVTGIVVDPATGDVYSGMLYDRGGIHYPKVVRFQSADGGLTAARQTTILDIPDPQGQSHQISNFSIGPDRTLYVHMGDGFMTSKAQDLGSFLGKILRMNLDGSPAVDNPFYNASDGIAAADYVYALGFRNPFGGAWRLADAQLFEVENGPNVDRLALVVRGRNYMWDGTNASMETFATYSWTPSTAPVNIAFIQAEAFNGSGFPAAKRGHAYMSESGPTWATGPQSQGKRITELVIDANGSLVSAPTRLLEYTGKGKATVAALAAGPDGLYFSELYKDTDYTSPIDRGARIFRVRHVGISPEPPPAVSLPGIIQAENFDQGGEGVAYHDSTTGNSGGAYRQTDVDLQATTDLGGGYNVGWIAPGEWLTYTVNVARAGAFTLEARVASNGSGGTFHVEVDGQDITGPVVIPNTGGWQNWTTLRRTVTLSAGSQRLRVVFDASGPGGVVGNLNYLNVIGGFAVPGTIQAEDFDDGGEGVAYHDSTIGNAGGAYRQTDVDLQATTDAGGGYNVGWMTAGEWLHYTIAVAESGTYTLTARVAANGAGGRFHVEFGGVDKTGPLTIPNTGGWQAWTDVTATVTLSAGGQTMRVVGNANGPTGVFGNLNYLKLATTTPSDIVLYAVDLTGHGAWSLVRDSSAAAGWKALTPDLGWATAAAPLATPADYLEATFDAPANTSYALWLRLAATGDTKFSESVWVQFSDARANGAAVYPIGSTSGLLVNLEACRDCGVSGWGWQNRAYWLAQPTIVTFATAARHTLRIQVREDGAQIDQIVLSPARYLHTAPGPVQKDTTIVPK